MELSYNINPENAPVNAKLCDYGAEDVVLLDGVSEVRNGTVFDVSGKTYAYVKVTGSFDAKITFLGYFKDFDNNHNENVTLYEEFSNECVKYIEGEGGFFIDLARYHRFFARVNEYTSGSVTVTATLFTKPFAATKDKEKERNVQIAYRHALSVEGGANVIAIPKLSVKEYPFQYITVRSDAAHDFRVSFYYQPSNLGGLGAPIGDIFALDIKNASRATSDWIEAKADNLCVYIYNDSNEAHTYDVYLHGIR